MQITYNKFVKKTLENDFSCAHIYYCNILRADITSVNKEEVKYVSL
jgi:hypothetical protein